MWTYSLTVEEVALVCQVGYERQAEMFGQPERNVNYYEGDHWEMLQHTICAGSELAFARMIGIKEFTPHVNKFKTELDVDGFEVRYTFPQGCNAPCCASESSRGRLRMTRRDDDDQIYVLIGGGLAIRTKMETPPYTMPPYVALGWAYGHECKKPEFIYNATTWYVPRAELHPMDTLDLSNVQGMRQLLQGA
jgi:hypothetical protein